MTINGVGTSLWFYFERKRRKKKKFWREDYSKLLDLKKCLSGQSLKSDQKTKRRCPGLAENLNGDVYRRSHTTACPTI